MSGTPNRLSLEEAVGIVANAPKQSRPQMERILWYVYRAGGEFLTSNQTADFLKLRQGTVLQVPDEPDSPCAICGRLCGDLKGATKSWRCAGRVAQARQKAIETGLAFSFDGKKAVRTLTVTAAKALHARAVLELWGGGQSARAMREALPSARIVSAEMNKDLWEALRWDAHEHDYIAHCGDVTRVAGTFDFIWLDFCGQWSAQMEDVVMRVSRDRLTPGGTLAITVMPAREAESFLARSRTVSVPALMVVAARKPLAYLQRYRRPTGHEMWLVILGSRVGETGLDFVALHDSLAMSEEWSSPQWQRLVKSVVGRPSASGTDRHKRQDWTVTKALGGSPGCIDCGGPTSRPTCDDCLEQRKRAA